MQSSLKSTHQKIGSFQPHVTNLIQAQLPFELTPDLGSGVFGDSGLPIYNPLILKNKKERENFYMAISFYNQAVDEYLISEAVSQEILEQTTTLINRVLSISGRQILETISHFAIDYQLMPKGTLIRKPVNYLMEALRIDGIMSQGLESVSYLTF